MLSSGFDPNIEVEYEPPQKGLDYELSEKEQAMCRAQGDLFEGCQYLDLYPPCDPFDFSIRFMRSDLAKDRDDVYSYSFSWGEAQTWQEFFKYEKRIKPFSGEYENDKALYWAGYIYRYWALWLGRASAEIIDEVPLKLLLVMYMGWHCVSPQETILELMAMKDKEKWSKE